MYAAKVNFARFASHSEVMLAGQIAREQVPDHEFPSSFHWERNRGIARGVPVSGRSGIIGTTTGNFWYLTTIFGATHSHLGTSGCLALEHRNWFLMQKV